MPFLRLYMKLNDLLSTLCLIVACSGVAFAIIALSTAALERLFFGFGYAILNDLPPLLMPWVVFPMMGVLLRADRHVTVDFLPHALSARGRLFLDIVLGVMICAAALWLLAGGLDALAFFQRLRQTTETGIRCPLWWIYLSFPVGFALLAWFALEKTVIALVELLTGTPIRNHREGVQL